MAYGLVLALCLFSFNLFSQTITGDSLSPARSNNNPFYLAATAHDSVLVDNHKIPPDSINTKDTIAKDSVAMDSLAMKDEKGDIATTIFYKAEDSIMMDVLEKKAYLYGKAQIKYQDMQLDAEQIEIKWDQNTIIARGRVDSTGKYIGHPIWKQGTDLYETDSMRYNIKTSKGIIHGIVTKQGEGFLQGDTAKRTEEAIFLKNGIYTTCDQKHPHFYIKARKLKVIPDNIAVCGPFNIVIEDIPTPIGLWMGLFPITDKKKSGIIFPTFGENPNRGMFLSKGGYYWAINDYVGLEVTGDIYANGSWLLNGSSNYIKRYQYKGSLSFSGSKIKNGFNPDAATTAPKQFKLGWQHSSTAKRSGNFTANVNLSSSKYDKQNNYTTARTDNVSNSSVTYSRTFGRSPFSTNISMRATQNNSQATATNSASAKYNVTLPSANLTMNRINPLKRKAGDGNKWYEKIYVNYGGNFNYDFNNVQQFYDSTTRRLEDSILQVNQSNLNQYILPNSVWKTDHTVTASSAFKVFKILNFNPSFNYFDNWHGKKLTYQYDPTLKKSTAIDTTSGFFRTSYMNLSFDLNTRIYGTKQFKGNGYLKGLRHTINPGARMTFAPDYSKIDGGGYVTVAGDVDSKGENKRYFQYLGKTTPQGKQAVMDFTIANILEAKLKNKKDTTGENPTKKMNLLDNLSLAGGYNFAADSVKMRPVTLNARTKLFGKIDLVFNSTHDPYQRYYDSVKYINNRWVSYNERVINTFMYNYNGKLARLTNLSLNASTSFKPKAKASAKNNITQPSLQTQADIDYINANPNRYLDFNIPWSVNLNYTYSLTFPVANISTTAQTIRLSGDLSLSPKWKIVVNSGFNITEKAMTVTNFTFSRDLHCWQMNMTLSTFSTLPTFQFTINAKSQLLQQLKLNKRSSNFVQ